MTIKRVKLSDALKKKGKSNEKLIRKMSPEEIHKRANTDQDNPPLTEDQLKEFALAKKRGKTDEKN